MSMKEAYQKKLQAQIEEWNLEIEKLKAQVKGYEADTQIEYENKIAELKTFNDRLRLKALEIENASEDAWEDLKTGAEEAKDAFLEGFNSAKSRFP